MDGQVKLPNRMSVAEFLDWAPNDGRKWQLFDGIPRAMAPARIVHGYLQSELAALLRNHLRATNRPCDVITDPSIIPATMAAYNMRIPDLAVSCTQFELTDIAMREPVVIIEILSPSNEADTRANVLAYRSIASVREILVLRTDAVGGEILRRNKHGAWPDQPEGLSGELLFASIGFQVALTELYMRTPLARMAP
jgi:Uma2 family endonuclease